MSEILEFAPTMKIAPPLIVELPIVMFELTIVAFAPFRYIEPPY